MFHSFAKTQIVSQDRLKYWVPVGKNVAQKASVSEKFSLKLKTFGKKLGSSLRKMFLIDS